MRDIEAEHELAHRAKYAELVMKVKGYIIMLKDMCVSN